MLAAKASKAVFLSEWNRLKEILRWDPTDKRERVRHDIIDIEAKDSYTVVEQNVTSRVQLPVAEANTGRLDFIGGLSPN